MKKEPEVHDIVKYKGDFYVVSHTTRKGIARILFEISLSPITGEGLLDSKIDRRPAKKVWLEKFDEVEQTGLRHIYHDQVFNYPK